MKRKRLTNQVLANRSRIAAPDFTSGMNPNTPIQIYDLKPNARFAVGDEVVPMDEADAPVKGIVVGHVAEDRLLVEWPGIMAQVDVDEVIAIHESRWSMSQAQQLREGGTGRKLASNSEKISFLKTLTPTERKTAAGMFENMGRSFDTGLNTMGQGISKGVSRINPFSQHNRQRRTRNQIFNQFGGNEQQASAGYNAFTNPQVVQFLQMHGLSPAEISNYATLRGRQLERIQQQQAGGQQTSFGQGSGRSFRFNPAPQQQQVPVPEMIASKEASSMNRVANLAQGLLNEPRLARYIRFLTDVVETTRFAGEMSPKGKRVTVAKRAAAKLILNLSTNLRKRATREAKRLADLLENNAVEALSLGA